MKKISKRTFIISTIVFILLLVTCFFAAAGEDEGTLGNNIILITLSKMFSILRFPTHTLLWSSIIKGGAVTFFAGLLINCMFYGFITERIISLFKKNVN
jgi:hypothetical protein